MENKFTGKSNALFMYLSTFLYTWRGSGKITSHKIVAMGMEGNIDGTPHSVLFYTTFEFLIYDINYLLSYIYTPDNLYGKNKRYKIP